MKKMIGILCMTGVVFLSGICVAASQKKTDTVYEMRDYKETIDIDGEIYEIKGREVGFPINPQTGEAMISEKEAYESLGKEW